MTHLALISILLFLASSGATYYLQRKYSEEELDNILERVEGGIANSAEEAVIGFTTVITMIEGGGIVTGIAYVIWYLIG